MPALTKSIYAIAIKVVIPANTSVLIVVFRYFRPKKFSILTCLNKILFALTRWRDRRELNPHHQYGKLEYSPLYYYPIWWA